MRELNVVALIPSLNPDEKLINYVHDLIKIGFKKIIIVNDGSARKFDKYFSKLEKQPECVVLKHKVNQGKGRALKTAFNYYLDKFPNYHGVVTADSDGQHSAKDTYNVALELEKTKEGMILGTRNFNEPHVPFRSKFGNKITTVLFKLLYGKIINDTQTGLRGLSNKCIEISLGLTGERFEYEINMLIKIVQENIKIKEVIIDTIYLNNNETSHFNPLKDSFKIYKVMFAEFFKFIFSGISSFLIDILLFIFLSKVVFTSLSDTNSIVISTILARIVSSLINYSLNKNLVFNSKVNNKKTLLKYYVLCVVQMLSSALFVSLLYNLVLPRKTICKIIVDLILFFISFNIQRKYIFKKGVK